MSKGDDDFKCFSNNNDNNNVITVKHINTQPHLVGNHIVRGDAVDGVVRWVAGDEERERCFAGHNLGPKREKRKETKMSNTHTHKEMRKV